MNRKAVIWSITLGLAAGQVTWAGAEGGSALARPTGARYLTLKMENAAPAEVAQRLGELLGGEVRFEGTFPETISIELSELPVPAALDRVAARARGKWERVYRLTTGSVPQTPVAPSGLTVTMRVSGVRCATAASMVARMAGGRIEAEGEIAGTVTLSATDMPLEEALDTIAQAAGMSWYPIYTLHGSYVAPKAPTAPARVEPQRAAPRPDDTAVEPVRDPTVQPSPSKRARPTEKKKKNKRDKYSQLGAFGAKPPPPQAPPDLQRLEELSRLGQFAGIFAMADASQRKLQVKRLKAGMVSQARKLENYEPRQRIATLQILVIHLRQYVTDFASLNDEQKQEVQELMEYIHQRLAEIEPLLQRRR